jgi:1-acyl-sn-glycerol-3-phosphate acyltransferase
MPSDRERRERTGTSRGPGRARRSGGGRGRGNGSSSRPAPLRREQDLTITETDAALDEATASRRSSVARREAERTVPREPEAVPDRDGAEARGERAERSPEASEEPSGGEAQGRTDDSSPGGIAGLIQRRARQWSLDDMDPGFAGLQEPLWNFVQDHYFRMEVQGWHRLPDPPTLMVGIHAAGVFPVEAWMFGLHWNRRFGDKRILHGTAHDMLMATPLVGEYFRKMGVVSASRDTVSAVLESGRDVLVYPGGEVDSLRPWTQRDEVKLAGRRGFVKQAIRSGVPIVPLAKTGGTDTMFTLPGGRAVARALGLKQLARIESLPLAVGLPWGIAPAVLPFIPLPAKLRIEILDPLFVDDDPERADDDEYVDMIYREIEWRIDQGVKRLARKRSFPVLG